ncbi:MAG: hypothetical protein Q8R17_00650 [bacterium]|nr:hypothetical protein [bacterium]
MATKIDERYAKTHEKLETTRLESRAARKKLIVAIMCDEKDVLALSDIKNIEKALAQFLKVQKRLGLAWFQNGNATAKILWQAGSKSLEETESLLD